MSLKIENSRRVAKSRPVCMDLKIWLKKNIHSLSEGSVPVMFISMTTVQKLFFIGQFEHEVQYFGLSYSGLKNIISVIFLFSIQVTRNMP
jgi:hypothetical protein